ncbi:MAG: RagB/SusD family nutrient uptake outer membrane protein [Prevotella sp.]|jgi:hypothetical protein|nr:RagB/SusD family nutrient uptake outer membrane protein [Prevotella sp.]
MKTIKVIILAMTIFCINILSCDVLDQVPESDITSKNFWKSPQDAESGLIAVYNQYRSSVYRSFELGEGRSDNVEIPPKWGYEMINPQAMEFNSNIIDANSGYCGWGVYYNIVTRANEVIYYTNQILFIIEADKNRILGEAHFLRASAYFYLVRNWGAVPHIVEPFFSQGEDMYVSRTEEKIIYEQIVKDLQVAEQYLPVTRSDQRIRATKAAAQVLLCDVLLTRSYTSFAEPNDIATVIAKADDVLANGNYTLLSGENYENIFRQGNTEESIFEIWSDYTQNATHNFCNYFLPRAYDKKRPYGGETLMLPSHSLNDTFLKEPDDLRYKTTITVLSQEEEQYYDNNVKGMTYGNKYLGTVTIAGTQRYSDDNIIIYRLPDAMYLKAEALIKSNKTDEAMVLVNKLRERAGLSPKTADSSSGALNILLDERRKEFAFEGKRWYDLVRTGKVIEFKTEPDFIHERFLLAVPQSEIDKNPKLLPQNPTF